MLESSNANNAKEAKHLKKKLSEAQHRMAVIDDSVKKLFDEKCAGNLSDGMFKNLMLRYDRERAELESSSTDMKAHIEAIENQSRDISDWVTLIKKHLHVERLDRGMVLDLIDSILVSEAYKVDGAKHQNIEIGYKFIGQIHTKQTEDIA